jgi:selenocysteine-specific elongation factor
VSRGSQLTGAAVWRSTRYLDASLQLVPDSPWPLKHWQRVRFHLGTAETLARVVLYGRERLRPGESDLVQLRLEQELVARAGDRFVLRFYSPVTTIGGGIVVDPWARRRARLRGDAAGRLQAIAEPRLAPRVRAVLEGRDGVSEDELAILVGAPPSDLERELEAIATEGTARRLAGRWYNAAAFELARESLLESLSRGHARDAGARGVSLESLRGAVPGPTELVNAVLADLEREGALRVEGSVAALTGHTPRLRPEQEELANAALARIREGRRAPPTVRELAAVLAVRSDQLLPVLKFLVQRGELVAVTADLYYDCGAIREVKQRVKNVLGQGRAATPSELRQALGVSRKYLIPLLEHLDEIGFTQRTGDGRVLRDGA